MNNLQRRAEKIAEEAKTDKPRLVSGTEPVKPNQDPMRRMSNSKRNRDKGKSTLKDLMESFNESIKTGKAGGA